MIKIFESIEQYNTFSNNGETLPSGWLYYVRENESVHFFTNNIDGDDKIYNYNNDNETEHYTKNYFTIEPLENGTLTMINNVFYELSVSRNGGETWENLVIDTPINLYANQPVIVKGRFLAPGSINHDGIFHCSNLFNVSGNILSIVYEDFANINEVDENVLFAFLSGNEKLISSHNLILAGETVNANAYNALFYNCTNMVDSPKIMCKYAGYQSFCQTFLDCSSLVLPPDLSNIEMSSTKVFSNMFKGCTTLMYPPKMKVYENLAANCFDSMFEGCTSLLFTPVINAKTLADYCFRKAFYGCTSLAKSEITITAETAPQYSCQGMFMNCSNLENVPVLYPKTLGKSAYNAIFSGCTKINDVTAYFENGISTTNLGNWLRDVAEEGTVHIKSGVTLTANSVNGCPTGWTTATIDNN